MVGSKKDPTTMSGIGKKRPLGCLKIWLVLVLQMIILQIQVQPHLVSFSTKLGFFCNNINLVAYNYSYWSIPVKYFHFGVIWVAGKSKLPRIQDQVFVSRSGPVIT